MSQLEDAETIHHFNWYPPQTTWALHVLYTIPWSFALLWVFRMCVFFLALSRNKPHISQDTNASCLLNGDANSIHPMHSAQAVTRNKLWLRGARQYVFDLGAISEEGWRSTLESESTLGVRGTTKCCCESSQQLVQPAFAYGHHLQVKRATDPQNMACITPLRMFACRADHGFSVPAGWRVFACACHWLTCRGQCNGL